jgi:hypothetical protein
MLKNTTLRILNPVLAILMLSQLLSGIWHSQLSAETFTWLHVRGGVALIVALVLHVAVNWDWVRTTGSLSENHIRARPCSHVRHASSKQSVP